jgi:hypothetical protein
VSNSSPETCDESEGGRKEATDLIALMTMTMANETNTTNKRYG